MFPVPRWVLSLILPLVLTVAWAQPAPPTALMFAPDGTIVGIGRPGADGVLELQVLASYTGPATLVLTPQPGDAHAVDVMVGGGEIAPRGTTDDDALAGIRSVATADLTSEADGRSTTPTQTDQPPGPPTEAPAQTRPSPPPHPETPPPHAGPDDAADGNGRQRP